MKDKIIDIILVLIIAILGYSLYDMLVFSKGELERIPYSYEKAEIELEGRAYNRDAKKLIKNLEKLPSSILEDYKDKGFKFVISDTDIAERYYSKDPTDEVAGLFDSKDKTIYISRKMHYINYATIHEVGHFVDYINNWTSETEEFASIFEEEKDSLKTFSLSKHYKSNSNEYFAHIINDYIKYGDKMKTSAPKSYEYIAKVINMYK